MSPSRHRSRITYNRCSRCQICILTYNGHLCNKCILEQRPLPPTEEVTPEGLQRASEPTGEELHPNDKIVLPATESTAAPDESNWSLSSLNSTQMDAPPSLDHQQRIGTLRSNNAPDFVDPQMQFLNQHHEWDQEPQSDFSNMMPNLTNSNYNAAFENGLKSNPFNIMNGVAPSGTGALSGGNATWPVEPGERCPTHTEIEWPGGCINDVGDGPALSGGSRAGTFRWTNGGKGMQSGLVETRNQFAARQVQGAPSIRTSRNQLQCENVEHRTTEGRNGSEVYFGTVSGNRTVSSKDKTTAKAKTTNDRVGYGRRGTTRGKRGEQMEGCPVRFRKLCEGEYHGGKKAMENEQFEEMLYEGVEEPIVEDFVLSKKCEHLIEQCCSGNGTVDEDTIMKQLEIEEEEYISVPRKEMGEMLRARMNAMYDCLRNNKVVVHDRLKRQQLWHGKINTFVRNKWGKKADEKVKLWFRKMAWRGYALQSLNRRRGTVGDRSTTVAASSSMGYSVMD